MTYEEQDHILEYQRQVAEREAEVARILGRYREEDAAPPPNEEAPVAVNDQGPEESTTYTMHSNYQKDVVNSESRAVGATYSLTTFASKTTTDGKRETVTWGELCDRLRKPSVRATKNACQLMKLGQFAGDSRETGSPLESMDVLIVEHDAGTVTVGEAVERLRRAGIRAAIYTSANHLVLDPPKYNGGPRWRVLAPLSQPIGEAEHEALVDTLNGALDGILAPESWHWARCYFFGQVRGVPYEFQESEGELLDVVAMCPAFDPIAAPVKQKATREIDRSTIITDDPVVDYMRDHWEITGSATGKVHVRCPWEAAHSADTGASSTSWLLATATEPAHFKCQHTSHGRKVDSDFLRAIGYDDPIDEFDIVTSSAAEEAAGVLIRVGNSKSPKVITDYLRSLPADEVHRVWAGLAAKLTDKAEARIVLEDVHRLTGLGLRPLNGALQEARAERARSQKADDTRRRAKGRTVVAFRPEDFTMMAREVDTAIAARAAPGEYVSFAGRAARVVTKALPYTHRIDDEDSDAPPVCQLEPLDAVALLGLAERAAVVEDGGPEKPRLAAMPSKIIDILEMVKERAAPPVVGVVPHPLVDPRSGRILATDGIDSGTGLYLTGATLPDARAFTQLEAAEALQRIRAGLLEGFEFSTALDADVAVAGLFTGVQRRVIDSAPGLAAMASTQSSGKTTLVRRIHVLLSGQDMPVSPFPMDDEAEVQKRLLAMLLRSPSMVVFDNLLDGTTFRSATVAGAMTSSVLVQRVLGVSREAEAPTNVLFCLTGNNLQLGADEVSRWMVCRLAPEQARPEERVFRHPDVVAHALRMRSAVLRDVVGIIAGYLTSDASIASATRFPRWDRVVRQPLMWAGANDVAAVFQQNAKLSDDLQGLELLLISLNVLFGAEQFTAAQVAKRLHFVTNDDGAEVDLVSALHNLRAKDATSERSIGRVLKAKVDRVSAMGNLPRGVLRSRVRDGRTVYWIESQA